MEASFTNWINNAYVRAKSSADNVSQKLSEGALMAKTAFSRSLGSSRSAADLEQTLLEYSELPELLVETFCFWSYRLRNSNGDTLYHDGENESLTFRHVLLRCDALENIIRTFVLSKRRKKSSYSESDLKVIQECLQEMFSYCMSGNVTLQKDILNLILKYDPVDDVHVEMLVDLVSILKYNWKDEVLLDERQSISNQTLHTKEILESIDIASEESTALNIEDKLKYANDLMCLYKRLLNNFNEAQTHCQQCDSEIQQRFKSFQTNLKSATEECHAIASKNPAEGTKDQWTQETRVFKDHINQCDQKIKDIYETLQELLERKQALVSQLETIEVEISMQKEMLNIKEQERQTAEEQLDIAEKYYNRIIEKQESMLGIYNRKLDDYKEIDALATISQTQILELRSSMLDELSFKKDATADKLSSAILSKANVHIEYMKSHLGHLKTLTGKLESVQQKQQENDDQNLDIEHIVREELHKTFIDLEKIWSGFVEFYSDNQKQLDGNPSIYAEMHTTYTQAKHLVDSFI
ncbi:hypothetical protein BdWA1_001173 [Babesia duncani]|uniref:Uncharacterized protein n=1 Tax=Babesia duncani TaxID=323732 RepID=A0AAD9PNJ7_9APIC|nr:hypothetical protein BdWA1_001173 [Babesia duncani]